MPTTTPAIKIDAVKRHGGEVVLAGESYSDAYGHAKNSKRPRSSPSSTPTTTPT
jgi:threonine dehydratase